MSEQITKTTEILVPYSLMERALEHYSAAHFNMHDFKRSSGKVFTWNGKTWTCTGGIGQGQKHLQASIREVVPQGLPISFRQIKNQFCPKTCMWSIFCLRAVKRKCRVGPRMTSSS